MPQEIRNVIDRMGISELQAYRYVTQRKELARRFPVIHSRNMTK